MNLARGSFRLALAFALIFGALGMLSCAPKEQRARVPETLQGEGLGDSPWQRDAVEDLLATGLPDSLRKLGAQSGKQTLFRQGERSVPVRVYELGSSTAAFEAVQTYPRAVNEYYFQMGASFVVVDAAALRSEERRPFLLAFQAAAMPAASSAKEN